MIATIRKLSMLQYNVYKFKNQMMIFCFRNQTVKNFHIIAIQKSWFNFYFDTIHHSLKNNHYFVFSNLQKMKKSKIKICMFVIKNISFSSLNFIYRIEDLITIKIKLHQIENIIHYFQLHNIYNKFDIIFCLILIQFRKTFSSFVQFNETVEHLIVENFNIHHFIWKENDAQTNVKFLKLIIILNEFALSSNLFTKTFIYFHFQNLKFIIDLCLSTKEFTIRIFICKTRFKLNHDFDHMFIEITFDFFIDFCFFFERYSWNWLNQTKFKKVLRQKFSKISKISIEKTLIREKLNIFISFLNKIIVNVIFLFIFKFIVSFRIISSFDEKCFKIRTRTNRVRKIFQQSIVREKDFRQIQKNWKKIKTRKKRIIKTILKIIHCKRMKKTTKNFQKNMKIDRLNQQTIDFI